MAREPGGKDRVRVGQAGMKIRGQTELIRSCRIGTWEYY